MIIHLLNFPDKPALVTGLRGKGTRDRFGRLHRFLSTDEAGEWRWDESRVCRTDVVMEEAVWDHSDPEDPVLVSPQQTLPGLFVLVALKRLSAQLSGSGNCILAYDGESGRVLKRGSAISDEQLAGLRINPALAGTVCEFAPEKEQP